MVILIAGAVGVVAGTPASVGAITASLCLVAAGFFASATVAVLRGKHQNARIAMRAKWCAKALGLCLPQPRTTAVLVASLVAALAVAALLRGPVFDLSLNAVGYHLSDEQIAANAARSAELTGGAWSAVSVVSSVVVEELMFRAPLIAALALASAFLRQQALRRAQFGIALLLVASSISFGWGHAAFSTLNAVMMVCGGLLWSALALFTRSLLPSVVSHSVYNFTALYL
ncbi:CPBP family intramembrane metalloprotease [Rhodococcus hoagii]|nr:CPBP family intramembrane metalloprotease [Prescottella equi]MBM4511380.1 CPBP family intramembrane metalloprotease [Prescottella equi]MBM4515514.1 CPBP family intramembrane metalloprotease [Prescottella equi]MBM4549411.1 CPBP family intramembrane metalloprotease [Prescottella equi]MBM4553423.1 CPBP family intramembrane metalloprotease [Prescottella equi]